MTTALKKGLTHSKRGLQGIATYIAKQVQMARGVSSNQIADTLLRAEQEEAPGFSHVFESVQRAMKGGPRDHLSVLERDLAERLGESTHADR